MFKNFTLGLLILLGSFVKSLAQGENSRFSIIPHISLGMLLPGSQEKIEGNQRMKYQWRFHNIGYTVNNEGKREFNLKTTNRIGVNLGYKVSKNFELNLGGSRANLVTAYKSTLKYEFEGESVDGFFDNYNYLSLNFGVKYRAYNLYYLVQGNYIPNANGFYKRRAKEQASSSAVPGKYINSAGTGLVFSTLLSNDLKYGLYLGIGQETLNGGNTELEFGFSFALQPLYEDQVSFYQNGNVIGINKSNHLINTIFVGVRQPFEFRKKEKIPKPPKERVPKKTTKSEKVEVGEFEIEVGEKLVLGDIQFEQSSSELNYYSQQSLNTVYNFMLKYPKAKIEISGHTSAEGDRRANIELSEKRAEACKEYLIEKGIGGRRIITLGFGPDRPISKKEEELNRRVELRVLGLD